MEALARSDFARLVGTAESDWFECKGPPPDVGSPRGLRDFLADVASFANATGGTIVYGLRSRIDATQKLETVDVVTGVDWSAVNPDQLLKVVRAHVRPLLHVEVRRYDDAEATLVAIVIDPQSDGPFLVDRAAIGGETAIAHAFGWPVRHGDATYWESMDRIQQLVSIGLKLPMAVPSLEVDSRLTDEAAAQLELIDALEEFNEWPYYSVQAIPKNPRAQVSGLYGDFLEACRRWRGVRHNGFDLGLDWQPLEPAPGRRLRSDGGRRAVIVSHTGVATAAAVGSPEMLGWANHQGTPWESLPFVEINPFVLIEYSTELVRFAYEAMAPHIDDDMGWELVARGHHLQGSEGRKPLWLREQPRRLRAGWFRDPKPPVDDVFEVSVESTGDALADAASLLTEVYEVGWAAREVPFLSQGRVDFGLMAAT